MEESHLTVHIYIYTDSASVFRKVDRQSCSEPPAAVVCSNGIQISISGTNAVFGQVASCRYNLSSLLWAFFFVISLVNHCGLF